MEKPQEGTSDPLADKATVLTLVWVEIRLMAILNSLHHEGQDVHTALCSCFAGRRAERLAPEHLDRRSVQEPPEAGLLCINLHSCQSPVAATPGVPSVV